jgi:hypothetical protein
MPGLLSDSELASIRSDVAAAACDTPCTIQRKTATKDAFGTETETWATIASVNVGMRQPSAGQLANYAFLIGSLAAWQVNMPVGTDVKHQDHLIIGGVTMVVQVDLSPQSYNALTTVLATEIR